MNDECPNDEGFSGLSIRHLGIRASFDIRHETFVTRRRARWIVEPGVTRAGGKFLLGGGAASMVPVGGNRP
jgi:hypothetical protein